MWRETPQFRKLAYHRVEVAGPKLVPLRSEWPEELRWVVDLFLASPQADGIESIRTPRFIVASSTRNAMLFTAWGTGGWTEKFKPWLDRNVGT